MLDSGVFFLCQIAGDAFHGCRIKVPVYLRKSQLMITIYISVEVLGWPKTAGLEAALSSPNMLGTLLRIGGTKD